MGGCGSVGPRPPWPPLPGGGPFDLIFRVLLEVLIEEIIREIIRQQKEALNPGGGSRLLMAANYEAEVKPFDREALLKSLSELPPEYADQLQDPEALIKRFNIDVPPERMPAVTAALAELHRERQSRIRLVL